MAGNTKNWNWFIPMLAIIFLALIMFKRAPESYEENPYQPEGASADDIEAAYAEMPGIGIALRELRGLAVDAGDRIFVAGDRKLLILDSVGSEANAIDLAESGSCLTVGGDGRIYVGFRRHIEVFDNSGKSLSKWEKIDDDSILTSLATVGKVLFAADAGNRKIWKFDLDGKMMDSIGVENNMGAEPRFIVPSPFFDVAAAGDGSIWVVNPGRHRLENFTAGGKLIKNWGKSSPELEGFCGCCNPTHIALMKDGSFVTSEKGYCRVKIYDQQGVFKDLVAGESQFKKGVKGLDLAITSQGLILVLDPKMKKIRIFKKKTD